MVGGDIPKETLLNSWNLRMLPYKAKMGFADMIDGYKNGQIILDDWCGF